MSESSSPRPALAKQPRHPSKWWGLLFSGIWLLYLYQPILNLVSGTLPVWARVAGVLITVAFAAIYLVGLVYGFRRMGGCRIEGLRDAVLPVVVPCALFAISFAMVPLVGTDSATYVIFAMVSAIFAWPVVVAIPLSVLSVGWLGLFLPMAIGHDPTPIVAFIGFVIAALMFGIKRMQAQEAVIKRAHEDMAQLAVDAERARFSRDLHDIVGHSLTAIIVKAELARRLAERRPEVVGPEVQTIEDLARETLEDVRRTVAGYREVTLSGELASARSVLDAAGISATLPQAVDEIPGEVRELFGWVVREGVTNVVRHSAARLCRIRVTPESVEVLDDGRGGKLPPSGGFTGLRERVHAKGGTLEAGPASAGGFRLYVAVPAAKPAGSAPAARRAGVQREGARA
ncbi:MAG: sensor histidine kinase [Streptosporangiales bacterium]